MNLLSILTERNVDRLKEKIQPVLESFYKEGINIEERISYGDSLYCLNYSVEAVYIKNYPSNDFLNIFKFCIADALYEYIRDVEEPTLLQYIINTDYCYFNVKERLDIYRNAINILKEEKKELLSLKEDPSSPRYRILQQLTGYLSENNEIHLNGFILFRLKDYLLQLNDVVERAVEDFLMNKEYNEFIKLLKYFVDAQETKTDIVHVVFSKTGEFKLYDRNNQILTDDYISSIAAELAESKINQEDILISTLITIAPKKIFIHGLATAKDLEILKTIEKIFPNHVDSCNSCELCTIQVNVNKE